MRESTRLVRESRSRRDGICTTQADEDDWNEFNDINKIVSCGVRRLTPSTRLSSIREGILRPFGPRGRLDASSPEREPSSRVAATYVTLIQTQVIRHQIRTEYKVQFPYLYTSRPRAVALAPYHHPPLYYVKPDDPDLPAFYFDPVVNPISAFRSKAVKVDDESEDDFSVMGLEPLLNERPLYTDATAGGIALYFAPRPFNLRRGRTRRAFDVPLVNAWFKERC